MWATSGAMSPLAITGLWFAAAATSASAYYVQDEAYSRGERGVSPVQRYHTSSATPPEFNLWKLPPPASAGAAMSSPRLTFIGTRGGADILQPAPQIIDDLGELVWEGREFGEVLNFGKDIYLGQEILSFYSTKKDQWFGGHWRVLNSSFDHIATIESKNTPISLDPHEFHVLDDVATVSYWEPVQMDLRSVEGPQYGWAFDCRVQSINITTGELLFEWSSAQHVPVTDSYNSLDQEPAHNGSSPETAFDYFHLNSAQLDSQGNYLLSGRGTSALWYVNPRTGEVLWRLGGRRSSFDIGDGAFFWFQHHARMTPTGTDTFAVSIFDNGSNQFEMKSSPTRGIILEINLSSMEARLKRQVASPFDKISIAEGSMQLFEDGHIMMGWGVQPQYTEFDENDEVVHSVQYGTDLGYMHSYRITKDTFVGHPRTLPSIALNVTADEAFVSWNGATEVTTWRILAADSIKNFTSTLPQTSSTRRDGFETTLDLVRVEARFLAIAGYDVQGNCLGASEIFSYDDATTTGIAAECPVDNVLPPSFEWPYGVPNNFHLALFVIILMLAAFAFYHRRPGTGPGRRSWIPGGQQYKPIPGQVSLDMHIPVARV